MFGTKKALLVAGVSLMAGALLLPARVAAQEPTSVTGCLAKGASDDSFTIKDANGKAYSLTSPTIKLAGHVGHTVTVTGTPAAVETGMAGMKYDDMKADTGMAKDTGMVKDAGAAKGSEGSALSVTKMEMVSATCK